MDITVRCPHCRGLVHIKGERAHETIQYHGIVKDTNEPLREGVTKDQLQFLMEENRIIGCGKPFILVRKSSVQYEAMPYQPKHRVNKERECMCHLF